MIDIGVGDEDAGTQTAGTQTTTPNQGVRLASSIELTGTGVRACVHNPTYAQKHWLPTRGNFVHRNAFRAHLYGPVAGRR